jgi:hypothetical protein
MNELRNISYNSEQYFLFRCGQKLTHMFVGNRGIQCCLELLEIFVN